MPPFEVGAPDRRRATTGTAHRSASVRIPFPGPLLASRPATPRRDARSYPDRSSAHNNAGRDRHRPDHSARPPRLLHARPAHPGRPRDLIDEVHDGERLGLGCGVHLASGSTSRRRPRCRAPSGAVSTADRRSPPAATNHNTRHPIVTAAYATTMHRLTGGRFTLGLGRGIAPDDAALGLPPRHHRAARGLRRADAPAVAGRDDRRPRRPGGPLPVPAPRPDVRRGHPARAHGLRAEQPRARRPGLRPGGAAHVLHRRDAGALRDGGEGRGRARPAAIRRRCGCGRAWRPSATTCPRTSG